MPAFAVTYAGRPVEGITQAIELRLTIAPARAARIACTTACAAKK